MIYRNHFGLSSSVQQVISVQTNSQATNSDVSDSAQAQSSASTCTIVQTNPGDKWCSTYAFNMLFEVYYYYYHLQCVQNLNISQCPP